MINQNSAFQKAVDTIEALSIDDQIMLIDLIEKRIKQQQREQLLREVKESEADYANGKFKRGSVADLMAELDS
jgi:hypothetical protein